MEMFVNAYNMTTGRPTTNAPFKLNPKSALAQTFRDNPSVSLVAEPASGLTYELISVK